MLLYLLSQLYPATLPHGRLGPGTNPKVPSVHHPASFAPFCPGCGSHPSRAHSCNPATPLLPITSLQPSQFHAVTHSFAQRRTAISPILNSFHTLSIATGVYPPAWANTSTSASTSATTPWESRSDHSPRVRLAVHSSSGQFTSVRIQENAMDKRIASADASIANLTDGATILVGGFGLCGVP